MNHPVELKTTVDERAAVTIVELTLQNHHRASRRVRITNQLNGPVLFSRDEQDPGLNWDQRGVTIQIDAGETQALGYACRAEAVDPPATICENEPATGTAGSPEVGESSSDQSTVETSSQAIPEPDGGRSPEYRSTGAPSPDATSLEQESFQDNPGRRMDSVAECRDSDSDENPSAIPPAIHAWLEHLDGVHESGGEVDAIRAVHRRTRALLEQVERDNDKEDLQSDSQSPRAKSVSIERGMPETRDQSRSS